MPEPHAALNALSEAEAEATLHRACGAHRWVRRLLARRPFASTDALYAAADEEWGAASSEDYLEAFRHHPQIGEDLAALRRKFQSTASLSSREQAGVAHADEATLLALRDGNAAYRQRHGFIFIICATGKSASEMLAALRQRIDNDTNHELAIAAREQAKITRLRLASLGLDDSSGAASGLSNSRPGHSEADPLGAGAPRIGRQSGGGT